MSQNLSMALSEVLLYEHYVSLWDNADIARLCLMECMTREKVRPPNRITMV